MHFIRGQCAKFQTISALSSADHDEFVVVVILLFLSRGRQSQVVFCTRTVVIQQWKLIMKRAKSKDMLLSYLHFKGGNGGKIGVCQEGADRGEVEEE